MQNLDSLTAAMSSELRQHERAHWLAAFDAAGVPAGPVHDIEQALTHPQVLARNMVVELRHPQAGPTRALGCPIHFSETPTQIRRPAPMLGEHTRELLGEYGYSQAQIDAFASAGVVRDAPQG
jgi:crotonobetainyl-CoA:carnitine CoA-transferase CaiB-like acyl-CoA transferase